MVTNVADYFEIDFLGVETKKSGDAITLRYSINGEVGVHVVDGGYIDTGTQIIEHIKTFYGATHIDNVVLTHPDQDHANGLRQVLEEFTVGTLWMNRPWLHVDKLLPSFAKYKSADALRSKLKNLYAATAALELLAEEKGIPIQDAFQGSKIGPFTILAPSFDRYLDCVAKSEKTPDLVKEESALDSAVESVVNVFKIATAYIKSIWGDEYFPPSPTSAENEMSLVQYAVLNDKKIMLTGDAGREALQEVIDYAPSVGLTLPGLNYFQVPHHGGRHNVSTEILDKLVGGRLAQIPQQPTWYAICSSAKDDADHPRKSVIRAMIHRGAQFNATESKKICIRFGIKRKGWTDLPPTDYPSEQEN